MLNASGLEKNLKIYEVLQLFNFLHLVTADDLE